MEELLDAFEATLEDRMLTRSERKALKQLIAEAQLDTRKQGALRAKIFEMARSELGAYANEQVVNWLENANKLLLNPPEEKQAPRVYFSPGDDCLNALTAQLRAARTSLHICVFTITDDRLSKAIIEAHQRGVAVKVITDNDKAHDLGSDIHRLVNAGIACREDRTDNHMHHKFAVVDKQTVITGSYNWTRSAATSNEENIVLLSDAGLAKEFQGEFDKLWKHFDVVS